MMKPIGVVFASGLDKTEFSMPPAYNEKKINIRVEKTATGSRYVPGDGSQGTFSMSVSAAMTLISHMSKEVAAARVVHSHFYDYIMRLCANIETLQLLIASDSGD